MSQTRFQRGFSLIELMVASTLVLVVFAGATYAVVNLQKRGNSEEGLADLQDVARGARELIAPRIERAGSALGNLLLTTDGAGGNPVLRSTFSVQSGAVVPPVAAYATLVSDSVQVYWGEGASTMVVGNPCGGSPSARSGNTICIQRLPTDPNETLNPNDYIIAANPNLNVAVSCLFKVSSVFGAGPGFPANINISPGVAADAALPAASPCPNPGNIFWTLPDVYVVKMGAATFQIDWTGPNGVPRLMYDPDGPMALTAAPVAVADNVERMHVRVGLVSLSLLNSTVLPLNPPPIVWFPDPNAATPRPAIDACTAGNAACVLGGNADVVNFPDTPDVIDGRIATLLGPGATADTVLIAQLMRRARIVELDLTVRSARVDTTLIQPLGAGYVFDGIANPAYLGDPGNPLDGRNRRHFVMRISLRNYSYAGI